MKKVRKQILLLVITLACDSSCGPSESSPPDPGEIIQSVVRHFFDQHNDFSSKEDVWGGYYLDLTFEAILFYGLYTENEEYTRKVLEIMDLRNQSAKDTIDYRSQPFCSINYALFLTTGDSAYIPPYISETRRMVQEVGRSHDGAVQILHQEKNYLLIDFIQEYCSRTARAGKLSSDSSLYIECVEQFHIYRTLLRNPESGLYCQGRGWLPDSLDLSPGAWSRGHGWLMRGMVNSMEVIPRGSENYIRLQSMLAELADALLSVQDADGMWHQLLHLPPEKSYPESSGTGMIAWYMALAYKNGYLEGDQYRDAALKACRALKAYTNERGVVYGTCKGPGPLRSVDGYLEKPSEPDDHHAAQAMIYGMLAGIILQAD
jgi:rhamnogalacturonyl hydrolase YesR